MQPLNLIEQRVLGCLIEKEITTPEYYPLSLNALVNACNQKSSREPVMQVSEADVRTALFELEPLNLVRVLADARVSKFEHRAYDVLKLRRDEIAVLGLLLLRGPQTSAELRARAERMYSFDDSAAALNTLERLAGREQPLTAILPGQPGSREARWMHLLGDPADAANGVRVRGDSAQDQEKPALSEDRLGALEERIRLLEERLCALERDSPEVMQ